MEDKILKDLFTQKERLEKALDKAVAKDIDKDELRLISSPDFWALLYSVIKDGKYIAIVDGVNERGFRVKKPIIVDGILPPHEAQIPKKDSDEMRTVYICENLDRVLLGMYNDYLFEKCSDFVHKQCKSYQSGIGTGKVVKEVVKYLGNTNKKVVAVKSDAVKMFDSIPLKEIDKTFDKINNRLGKSRITDLVQNLLHQNLCFDMDNKLIEHYFSIGQGIATASFFADAILYDIDEYISENFDVYYVRYSDDVLICGNECEKAFEKLKSMFEEKGLKLNPKKTEFITKKNFFKFLGFSIRNQDISPSSSRIKDFQKEIEKRTIKFNDFLCIRKIESGDSAEIKYAVFNRKTKTYFKEKFDTKKECVEYLNFHRFKVALIKVIDYLFIGDGKYSWSTSMLTVINVKTDLHTMSMWVIDILRAMLTGKYKVGGLGYEPNKKDGVITRGIGQNVKSNREKTPKELPVIIDLTCMRNIMLTDKDLFYAEVRNMKNKAADLCWKKK